MGLYDTTIDFDKEFNPKQFRQMMSEQPMMSVPTMKWCIEIASKIPCSCLEELFDNARKIQNHCKQVL